MDAGRELDQLIAERVMGGFVSDPDALSDTGEVWYWLHPKDGVLRGEPYQYKVNPVWDHQWARWEPSTDIAAAWVVVEKMKEQGNDFYIEGYAHFRPRYDVNFKKAISDSFSITHMEAQADTLPLAICLAALKALGVS